MRFYRGQHNTDVDSVVGCFYFTSPCYVVGYYTIGHKIESIETNVQGWGTHLKSDGYVPTSISKGLLVLISLCTKGGHCGINTSNKGVIR